MIRNVMSGETGNFLTVPCNVVSTYQSTIAVNDFVGWATTENCAVNSAADATNIETLGVVQALNSVSSIATVKWLGWNRIIECTYSGTPVRGSSCETETAASYKVSGTSNATLGAGNNRVIAVAHKSGKCLVAIR